MSDDEFFTGYPRELERPTQLREASIDPARIARLTFSAPPEIDPRPWHKIENQGSMGSCQGHALSSVCEMAHHIATGKVTQFSPLFGYYATQQIDGLLGRDVGSTIAGGAECAKRYGMAPLEAMPYPNPVRYTGKIPQEAFAAAAPFKIRTSVFCRTYDDVFNFLASGQGGVEIGIGWSGAMNPVNGVIGGYRPGGGGHAVAFLGYSARKDGDGRQYLWLANSWAPAWGNDGWAEVAPKAVAQMLADQYTVMVGLSDLSTPTPRPVDWKTTTHI